MDTSKWYHKAVDHVLTAKEMTGTSSSTFEPDTSLSRAMIVQILYNMEGRPDAGASSFKDVKSADWFASAVNWAAANDIVSGYSADEFGPMDSLTREQMAAVLRRYAQYKHCNVLKKADISSFADSGDVSSWALEDMCWAVGQGLISGTGNNMLSPQGTASRAQAAQVIMNFDNKILNK